MARERERWEPDPSVAYAHTHRDGPWQPLDQHLLNVAEKACEFASVFGAGDWGYCAGLWHDLGKYSREFQARLRGGPVTDHSTAGAQWASKTVDPQAGRLLAFAIAGHHPGLPNGRHLEERLRAPVPDYSAAPLSVRLAPCGPQAPGGLADSRVRYQLAFFTRMLFSCLVDADFLDTETFVCAGRSVRRGSYPELEALERKLSDALRDLQAQSVPSLVNAARQEVLQHCLREAERAPGLFTLTVPTGGGKTLSSLAFALRHARRHGLVRVIYVLPYTSVIEQNAAVFRHAFGDLGWTVVEHHCNLDPDEQDERAKLATENWDAPLIVTTNVQFFESLYGNRVSACRKLHNLARSVIVLDEAQALPVSLLEPCLETLRELVSPAYGASVLLCTATQPALNRRSGFPRGLDIARDRELIPDPPKLFSQLRRVDVKLLGRRSDAEIAEALRKEPRVLCIVNTTRHARRLFETLGGTGCYHLSARMCPAHRSRVFGRIRKRLRTPGAVCRVVSTQLVEAGVDLDFPVVYRAEAGIDSIAQAAGRCNREGRAKRGTTFVFQAEEPPPPGMLRQTAQAAELVLPRFENDPIGLAAVRAYFERHFWAQADGMDRPGILQRLKEFNLSDLQIPFEDVAQSFRMIEQEGKPLLVEWSGRARRLIRTLETVEEEGWLLRKLQRYTVQVYPFAYDRLEEAGALRMIRNRYAVLCRADLYDLNTGLNTDEIGPEDPERYYCE